VNTQTTNGDTTVERATSETRVRVRLSHERTININTTERFLDHMLTTLARYAGVGLEVEATGDLPHHIAEDVAICVGKAFASFAPVARARFGDRTIPMDDALVHCALDFGGRPFYRGPLPSRRYDHWMRSFADNASTTLHLRVLRGIDRHHIVEAAFKALGLALADALRESDAVFSTKGESAIRENG
jgi:imidazoleglycerol-phosphate dehydratase